MMLESIGLRVYFLMVLFFFTLGQGLAQEENSSNNILIEEGVFTDNDRDREVAYLLYRPKNLSGQYPIIIFSHGLGGSKRGGAYLGEFLAQNGFITFHIQHSGSDESIWKNVSTNRREALEASLRDRNNAVNRFKDIPFVVDQIELLEEEGGGELSGHLDLSRIGMAGHSYGGKSTMVASGEKLGRINASFKEDRIKASLVLSPNLPRRRRNLEQVFEDINVPMFHMTGTEDRSPLSTQQNMDPSDRTKPYEYLNKEPKYLLVLDGADHATFSGRRVGTSVESPKDVMHLNVVKQGALLFFDAYLRGNDASAGLLKSSYEDSLEETDIFKWGN